MNIYRKYSLEKGSKKYYCPSCTKKTLVRYLDTETGEHVNDDVGRCDREIKCQYHYRPYEYLKDHKVLTTSKNQHNVSERTAAITKRECDKIYSIPMRYLAKSVGTTSTKTVLLLNNFYLFLVKKFGVRIANKTFEQFYVGSTYFRFRFTDHKGYSSPKGRSTIFWLIDEKNRIRGGQVVLFNHFEYNCATVKIPERHVRPVYLAINRHFKDTSQTIPKWLEEYQQDAPKIPILFGLHQLNSIDFNKPIAICESYKTAIISSIYLPNFTWMATGSLSYLSRDRLLPLKGRNIILFPDVGAYDKWMLKAKNLEGLANIQISRFLEDIATEDDREKGIDLADYLLRFKLADFNNSVQINRDYRIKQICSKYPNVRSLVERLNLVVEKVTERKSKPVEPLNGCSQENGSKAKILVEKLRGLQIPPGNLELSRGVTIINCERFLLANLRRIERYDPTSAVFKASYDHLSKYCLKVSSTRE